MNGFPSAERLAQLTSFSQRLNAAGAPAPFARPIAIDEKGYVWGVCPSDGDGSTGAYMHAGVRLGWAPLPLQQGLLISIWGGLAAEPGFEEEGVTAFVTRDGLRRLAADLIAIADASEPS